MYRSKKVTCIRTHGRRIIISVIVTAVLNGSCFLDTKTNLCGESGLRCPPGWACTADLSACILGSCGNGVIDGAEVCDDGNVTDGDGCSADCTSNETCGNGIIDMAKGEACDDGNTRAHDGCSPDCRSESKVCGNLIVEKDIDEVCDDGNVNSGDGCSADCMSNEACGNGIIDNDGPMGKLHEECDPVNSFPLPASDTAECDSDCTKPRCGDGHYNPKHIITATRKPEECDTGGDSSTCDDDCTIPICGDNHINPSFIPPGATSGEVCDNGIANSDTMKDACRKNCQKASCGDGVKDTGEMCDDGNNDTTDACPDGPDGTCKDARCGDGLTHAGVEGCDDGGVDTATCNFDCTPPHCGDGHINEKAGERCEDDFDCNTDEICIDCKCMARPMST
jgi:cysteine-rich repeat protein